MAPTVSVEHLWVVLNRRVTSWMCSQQTRRNCVTLSCQHGPKDDLWGNVSSTLFNRCHENLKKCRWRCTYRTNVTSECILCFATTFEVKSCLGWALIHFSMTVRFVWHRIWTLSVAQGACMQRIQQFLKWNVKFNPNIQLNLVTSTWTDTLQLYLHTGAFALFADY